MASQSVLLFAFVFIAASSLAHGLILDGVQIAKLSVAGHLYCSVNGNLGTNTPGIAGVNVVLACNGGKTTLGHALTDPSGFFEVVLDTLDGILFEPSVCSIYVKLPLVECTVLPPTGTLYAVPTLIGVVQSLLGPIAKYNIGSFAHAL